ncbi:MAG: hypothetical protein KKG47_15715 [Proteobacteria bacterium]|nr:hypothetical protein [Pseudomonadota bacterium]MBU1737065.1 hypothetical protein [Pseudomonadota bacterium]
MESIIAVCGEKSSGFSGPGENPGEKILTAHGKKLRITPLINHIFRVIEEKRENA